MLVYANCTTSVVVGGVALTLNRGEAWDANDPFVTQRPDLFGPNPPVVRTSEGLRPFDAVEQATAAPGERRGNRAR